MNLNRYRILEDGSHFFHTFKDGQLFNENIWLENKHGVKKENGEYYKYYTDELSIDESYKELEKDEEGLKWEEYNNYKNSVIKIETTPSGNKYNIDESARIELLALIREIDDADTMPWREENESGGYINYQIGKVEMQHILKERNKLVKEKFNDIFGGA